MAEAIDLKQVSKDPLWDQNPITLHVLGICSALAVTGSCNTAFTMCAALTGVLCISNLVISLVRQWMPGKVKIIIQLAIIATLVIIADQILRAFFFEMSKQLSVFVGLIITNCIVLGRAEAFALGNPPLPSFLDGIANGLGYSLILMFVAVIRELLGPGTLFGYDVLTKLNYEPNGLMVLPPAAFFLIGLFIWVQRSLTPKLIEE